MKNPYRPEQRILLRTILGNYVDKRPDAINESLLVQTILDENSDLTPLDFECISEMIQHGYCYDGVSQGYEREVFEIKQIADRILIDDLNRQAGGKSAS